MKLSKNYHKSLDLSDYVNKVQCHNSFIYKRLHLSVRYVTGFQKHVNFFIRSSLQSKINVKSLQLSSAFSKQAVNYFIIIVQIKKIIFQIF